jgi:hypothetical protein
MNTDTHLAAVQSETERNKAVVDEYFKAGVQGRLTSVAAYLHPGFTVTAPNYLPWAVDTSGQRSAVTTYCQCYRRVRFRSVQLRRRRGRGRPRHGGIQHRRC